MLTHDQIWRALDRLASQAGLSASALARRAGLDPTAFNRSKRIGPDGRARWPSTESLAKALAATGTTVANFVDLIEGEAGGALPISLIAEARFDERGAPAGAGWSSLVFPAVNDTRAFALEVAGDTFSPVYRDGDVIVVSPRAPIRRGDRVVIATAEGDAILAALHRRSARGVELLALDGSGDERVIPSDQVAWMARIVWVRQ